MTTMKPFTFASDAQNPFLRAGEPKSPFAPTFPLPTDEVAADAPEGSYTYKLVQSGPAVPAEECETAVAAVEILIRWGSTVLHVDHLTPPRSFFVGEDQGKGQPRADFFLPEEKLGTRRMPVVLVSGGAVRLVIPAGATGSVTLPGGAAKSVAEMLASGATEPCPELAGAAQVVLPTGARAALEVAGVSFEVSAVHAGKKAGRLALTGESLPYQGLSFLLHAGLLAATALFMPSMAMADEDRISDDQKYQLIQALSTDAMKELDKKQEENTVANDAAGQHGDVGTASKGESGAAGSTTSHATNARFAIKGTAPEQSLSRMEALREAQSWGMIGVLNSLEGSTNVPTAPWGRELASGNDDLNAKGNMWGTTIGEAGGAGGLALIGIGEGGGGPGEGIGVGRVGTVGHDFTGGTGHSGAFVGGRHQVKAPAVMRTGTLIASGRLPPEVIQRVVRQNFGRFKACYENGLRGNPNLQGRVAVRFVIGHDGAITSAANGGSDLPDAGVVSCVTRAFYGLSFPQPENGIVTVTYPIVFSASN
jgi:hypothetical protein